MKLAPPDVSGVFAAEEFVARILSRPEAEFDNCSRVGNQLGLPAVIFLKFLHSSFGLCIPVARRLAGEISRPDQGSLNLGSTSIVDSRWPADFEALECLVNNLGEVGPRLA